MDSGSSKGFDFASDDILSSNQNNSNGTNSDSAIATNPSKEFHKSRMSRPSDDSGNQDVIIAAVERCMKKHSENVLRFLEGISSRLSQLELYCYNVDKSIGGMRSDLARDYEDSDAKLQFIEKHLQEVHRSVQVIRDKQELADTQTELAKLQLTRKDSSSAYEYEYQKTDETSTPPAQRNEIENHIHNHNHNQNQNQQLALALPAPQMGHQPITQPQTYYLSPPQLPAQNHQYLQPGPHYQTHPPQQPPQPAVRPASAQVFPSYLPGQQVNPETLNPNNIPMQMPYGIGGSARTNQAQPQLQPPPQHMKPAYGGQGQPGGGYVGGSHGNTYMIYESGSQAVYPPPANQQQINGANVTNNSNNNIMARPPPQFMGNRPYNELVDKLGSMGFRGEHVMSVIQRLEETGQTVDFNTVLDRLNVHTSAKTNHW